MVLRPKHFILLFCLCFVWCCSFFVNKDKWLRNGCSSFSSVACEVASLLETKNLKPFHGPTLEHLETGPIFVLNAKMCSCSGKWSRFSILCIYCMYRCTQSFERMRRVSGMYGISLEICFLPDGLFMLVDMIVDDQILGTFVLWHMENAGAHGKCFSRVNPQAGNDLDVSGQFLKRC